MPAWTTGVDNALKRQAPPGPPVLTPEQLAFDNSHQILSITGTFFTAALIVVLLRCYVRLAMLKVFGIDDYVMVVAMVCYSRKLIRFLSTDCDSFWRRQRSHVSNWSAIMGSDSTSWW
jgi:hypothetical protein